jgi:hypothetical protein
LSKISKRDASLEATIKKKLQRIEWLMTELNNHRENDESDANLKTKGDLGDLC